MFGALLSLLTIPTRIVLGALYPWDQDLSYLELRDPFFLQFVICLASLLFYFEVFTVHFYPCKCICLTLCVL